VVSVFSVGSAGSVVLSGAVSPSIIRISKVTASAPVMFFFGSLLLLPVPTK
jgi:hypothetical protein